jgi:hypothetical protein
MLKSRGSVEEQRLEIEKERLKVETKLHNEISQLLVIKIMEESDKSQSTITYSYIIPVALWVLTTLKALHNGIGTLDHQITTNRSSLHILPYNFVHAHVLVSNFSYSSHTLTQAVNTAIKNIL